MRRAAVAAAIVVAAASATARVPAAGMESGGGAAGSDAALRSVTLPAPPVALAIAGDRVWVVTTSTSGRPFGELFAVDARTIRVVRRTRLGADPRALAVTDRTVWIAHGTAERRRGDPFRNTLVRIDPRTASVADRVRIADTQELAADERGVWLLARARGGSLLSRRDAETGRLRFSVRLRGLARQGALALGGRSVWALTTAYSARGARSQVTRVDARRGRVRAVIPLPWVGQAVAFGRGSLVAAANRDLRTRPGRLMEIVAGTGALRPWHVALPSARDVAVAGRTVWVSGGLRSVFAIDVASRRIRRSVLVRGSTEQVVAGAGGVWVLDPLGRRVVYVASA